MEEKEQGKGERNIEEDGCLAHGPAERAFEVSMPNFNSSKPRSQNSWKGHTASESIITASPGST